MGYEAKNIDKVCQTIYNFAAQIRTTVPEFKGPFLGRARNARVEDRRRKTMKMTDLTRQGSFRPDMTRPDMREYGYDGGTYTQRPTVAADMLVSSALSGTKPPANMRLRAKTRSDYHPEVTRESKTEDFSL